MVEEAGEGLISNRVPGGRLLLICCAASLSLDHSPCTAGVTQAVCECVGLEVVRGSEAIEVVAILMSCSW